MKEGITSSRLLSMWNEHEQLRLSYRHIRQSVYKFKKDCNIEEATRALASANDAKAKRLRLGEEIALLLAGEFLRLPDDTIIIGVETPDGDWILHHARQFQDH